MKLRRFGISALASVLLFCSASPVLAASSKTSNPSTPKGLLVAPATAYVSINAGSQKTANFTVANYTNAPITASLAVKQFTVSNYTYSYNFSKPVNNWLTLGVYQISLAPNQSQQIPYTITVPSGSPSGGSYYTLFASTTVQSGALASTLQAASLLYLTVNGKLIRTSHLASDGIQHVSFGGAINYHFNVTDTGNIYYFMYVSGQLHGLSVRTPQTSIAHILMPGKVRQFSGSINAPLLPGLYHATYGYKTDAGNVVQRSQWVLYIPPWSIAAVCIILLALNLWITRRKRHHRKITD